MSCNNTWSSSITDPEGVEGIKKYPNLNTAFLVNKNEINQLQKFKDILSPQLFQEFETEALKNEFFVYSFPMNAKSYAFVFVANSDAQLHELFERFLLKEEIFSCRMP